MTRFILVLACIIAASTAACGQVVQSNRDLIPKGLSVSGGIGHFAITDEYLSQERYSGSLPYFDVSWLGGSDTTAYRLGLEYRHSAGVRNYNVSAGVTQASLNLDFMYYAGAFSFLGRNVFAYVGPSSRIYLYYRQQKIADGGDALFNAYSFAMLLSGGINSRLVVPLTQVLSAELAGELDLISFGARIPDMYDQNSSAVRFVTLLSGACGNTQLLLRYDLTRSVSISGGYRFEICQNSSWSYLISASDNVVLQATCRF